MVGAYFLWFDNWTFKNERIKNDTEYSVWEFLLFIQMNGSLKFSHAWCCYVYLSSARFLNICKPKTTLYLILMN